jgi:DNA-directed RNA polymerase subunit RPC12/RpoP
MIGAFFHPYLYRCPRCNRRVQVPDPTEAGGILLEDPLHCPGCGARLKGFEGPGRGQGDSAAG